MTRQTPDPNDARPEDERVKPPPFRPDRRLITYLRTARSPEEVRAIIERDTGAASEPAAPENAT